MEGGQNARAGSGDSEVSGISLDACTSSSSSDELPPPPLHVAAAELDGSLSGGACKSIARQHAFRPFPCRPAQELESARRRTRVGRAPIARRAPPPRARSEPEPPARRTPEKYMYLA